MALQEGLKARPILAVVGPTASGKTRLGLDLARRLRGEVVSADMGQLYKRLDAGTAKPPGEWRSGVYMVEEVPHHLIDILDPADKTDAGDYSERARPVIEDIRRRGRLPIVVGGTGLFVQAALEGLDPLPKGDSALRARLAERSRREGRKALHAELGRRDPAAARRIPANNLHRVIRALEVFELTGRPISELWTRDGKEPAEPGALYLGIRWERGALRSRIEERARSMFPAMVEEVRSLVPSSCTGEEPGFRCLGYPEALAAARGETSAEQGLAGMVRSTSAYAKRQETWFRRKTPVRWLGSERTLEEALEAIEA